MSKRITRDALHERLSVLIEDGNGSAEYYKEALDYLLYRSAESLPEQEYQQTISPWLRSVVQSQKLGSASHLSHCSSFKVKFIQDFVKQQDIEELIWNLRNGHNALPVKSHSKRNFTGSSLVDWLLKNYQNLIHDRAAARCVCDYLHQQEKLFYHPKYLFRDDGTVFMYTLPKRVVIVGGGFSGSHIAAGLEKDSSYQVILIAPNPFECIPSFPFLLGNIEHATKIRAEHSNFLSTTKVIKQKVSDITPRFVIMEDGSIIKFDNLVIATGSSYPMPFDGDNVYDSTNSEDMIAATNALGNAKSACVVGAGSVGIEVASEIAARFPQVKLTIVSSSELFLERSAPDAHKYVHEYFSSFPDVTLVMGERIKSYENNIVLTDAGTEVQADVLFPCLGFKPRTSILLNHMPECIDEKGFLNVIPTLQLSGYPHIFGAGDIVPVDTEKLAQNAEAHADIITKNIPLLDKASSEAKMKKYSPHNRVMLVSLGSKRCLMINGSHVLMEGAATRLLKSLVEKKVMHAFK